MTSRIEDYALIGDTQTAALVSREGSIDWLCVPRFDSSACFAALLGEPAHGRWLLAPEAPIRETRRRYRDATLVLETEHATGTGRVRVTDCMPPRQRHADLVRLVEGLEGEVTMTSELRARFDYGSIVPWVRGERPVTAIGGPDALSLHSPIAARLDGGCARSTFTVRAGDRVPFVLVWHPSHEQAEQVVEAAAAIEETTRWWQEWSAACTYEGPWREPVRHSLVTLKALTYGPSGGIVAAPTTSLPEALGGSRNWDYRYCWLRDATFTLYALLNAGYRREAAAWRDWLLRAVAGEPSCLQSRSCPGCRGTPARCRCASATRRIASASSTSTGR